MTGRAAAFVSERDEIEPGFESRLRRARRRLLFLDYDGTLAPYRVAREQAAPPPRMREALRRIVENGGTELAVVSGRPVDQLLELLRPLEVPVAGEHGWEVKDPGHEIERHVPDAATRAALDDATRDAEEHGLREGLERKRTALVLHVRGLSAEEAAARVALARALWAGYPERAALRLDPTNGGIELRSLGHDKGSFVRTRWVRAGDGALAVYVGDDCTDEDAFAVVRHGGIGIRVGPHVDTTAATACLDDLEAVADFLERWLDIVPASATAPPEERP